MPRLLPPGNGGPTPYQQPYGQQPYPYPLRPPQKKRTVWPWVLGSVVLTDVLLIGGGFAVVNLAEHEAVKESERAVEVTYRVTASGVTGMTASWWVNGFEQERATNIAVPWEKKVTVTGISKLASVTVDGAIGDGAYLKCEIVVDGKVEYTQTVTGPHSFQVECSGDA